MQIGAYIILITTTRVNNHAFVDHMLRDCFCCVFAVHGLVNSLAVCEDVVHKEENGLICFRHYDNYLRSVYSEFSAITIQEYGDLSDVPQFIVKLSRAADLIHFN